MEKYENFCNALGNLKDIYTYEEPYDNVVMTGLVYLYKICFEQSWKAIKEILFMNGVAESQADSPRQILKSAYQVEMIKDEELWLAALISGNNVTHAYTREVAKDIIVQTKEKYYQMFVELKEEIDKNWK